MIEENDELLVDLISGAIDPDKLYLLYKASISKTNNLTEIEKEYSICLNILGRSYVAIGLGLDEYKLSKEEAQYCLYLNLGQYDVLSHPIERPAEYDLVQVRLRDKSIASQFDGRMYTIL